MHHGIGHMVTGRGEVVCQEGEGRTATTPWTGHPQPPPPWTGQPPPPQGRRGHWPTTTFPQPPNIRALCTGWRYASYWNAFLYWYRLLTNLFRPSLRRKCPREWKWINLGWLDIFLLFTNKSPGHIVQIFPMTVATTWYLSSHVIQIDHVVCIFRAATITLLFSPAKAEINDLEWPSTQNICPMFHLIFQDFYKQIQCYIILQVQWEHCTIKLSQIIRLSTIGITIWRISLFLNSNLNIFLTCSPVFHWLDSPKEIYTRALLITRFFEQAQ